MIIEVKTVEILAKQKMQFEATTVVKEEKLIKFMTGFKNSLKETRNDGYISVRGGQICKKHTKEPSLNALIMRTWKKYLERIMLINIDW